MKIEARPTGGMGGVAWSAIDSDTYDGAEDSSNRNMVGFGPTKQDAIADLQRLFDEMADYEENK